MHGIITTALFAALAAAAPAPVQKRGTDAPFGNKKGLAYNDAGIITTLATTGSATWAYDWSGNPSAALFQKIPMCWGPGSGCASANILTAIAAGDRPYVLGYNEPDETAANGGCNTAPAAAWSSWSSDTTQFLTAGAKLVCPAVTSWDTTAGHTGGPAGLTWLAQFVAAAGSPSNLKCTAQALHWYGVDGQTGAAQAQLFISHIAEAHTKIDGIFQTTDFPLWITEFAPLPLKDVTVLSDFLAVVIPWLDAQDYVARYSPFMAEYMVTNGVLNAAGVTFVDTK